VDMTSRRNDVKLLRWPAESGRRALYQAQGVLRVLVVEGGVPAPICSDVREDWVRAPITENDLRARIASLRARAEAHRLPHVDPHGLLRYGGRSITVSRTETDLMEALIRQYGVLVSRETLLDCLPDRPGGTSRNALDLHIMRLRRRIEPLGLAIRTVWGRGYLLAVADAEPDELGVLPTNAQPGNPQRPLAAADIAALRWSQPGGPQRPGPEHLAAS
jgi:DNA-binding winged helix-turn-helix (wHTH) protein